jgi:hypothetical protein
MAKGQPICIITPSGMKCLSSPIKQHFPGSKRCRIVEPISAGKSAALEAVKHDLGKAGVKPGAQEVIARVVELMMAYGVDGRTPFTIVKA